MPFQAIWEGRQQLPKDYYKVRLFLPPVDACYASSAAAACCSQEAGQHILATAAA